MSVTLFDLCISSCSYTLTTKDHYEECYTLVNYYFKNAAGNLIEKGFLILGYEGIEV